MADRKRTRSKWIRFSGMGFEFAAALIGFCLVGIWIDRAYDTGPAGVLIGAALGILGGGTNFIRSAMAATREAERQRSEPSGDDNDA